MDRRERSGDLLAGLLALQQTWMGELYVALPGIVQSFDATKRTCVVQPAIKAQIMSESGGTRWDQMPLLLDCPVVFPGGGDVVLTFPLKQGDEVLVLFSDRCIDAWWQSGGIQNQAELRMHDLSDGYCLPGPSSIPRVEAGISTSDAQLRSRDGVARVRLDPATHGVFIETDTANVTVTPGFVSASVASNTIQVSGSGIIMGCGGSAGINITPSGVSITGTSINIAGRNFLTHHHTDPQGGNTGDVV